MRKLVMGCAVAALVALSAPSVASPPASATSDAPVPPITKGERGIASWYGEECQGNLTANGEIYDINGLTAAHRELPLGTKVKVTNLRNNRTIVLRVNDRGPFTPGRFLDVSMAAAKQLGFLGSGTALVEVEIVSYPKGYLGAPTDKLSQMAGLNLD